MNETFTCGDHGALLSYLYDECTPAERRAIIAHAAICLACAEELAALSSQVAAAFRSLGNGWVLQTDALRDFAVHRAPPTGSAVSVAASAGARSGAAAGRCCA